MRQIGVDTNHPIKKFSLGLQQTTDAASACLLRLHSMDLGPSQTIGGQFSDLQVDKMSAMHGWFGRNDIQRMDWSTCW
jgi:hypothetical protein